MPPHNKKSLNSSKSPTRKKISRLSNANCDEEQEGGSSSYYEATKHASSMQCPHEVLRASLEFQKSPSLPLASSLYPSMECVSRAASDFDFEADWNNASVSSREDAAITIPLSSTINHMRSNSSYRGRDISISGHNSASSEGDFTEDAGTENAVAGIATGMKTLSHMRSNSSHRGRDTSISRLNSTSSEGEFTEDAGTEDAVASIATGMPLAEPTRNRQYERSDENLYVLTAVESHISSDRPQIPLSSEVEPSTPTPVAASSCIAEAEAEVMIFEYETIHPLEAQSVVQAELLHQDENGHEQDQISHARHDHYRDNSVGTTVNDVGTSFPACGSNRNLEIPTEATVIESGPLEKATIAALSGDSTETVTEAVVLQGENDTNPFENNDTLDTRSSSLRSDNKAAIGTMSQGAREQSRLNGGGDAEVDTIAAVLDNEYNLHPSGTTNHSAQAELIGNLSTDDFISNEVGMISHSSQRVGSIVEVNETERPTEATVLDSGPPDKATVDAWSARPPEEAQVLQENVSVSIEDDERKMPPCDVSSIQDIGVSSDHQAEIVEISESESFHPVELESATTAQLIGNDPNSALHNSGRVYEEDATVDIIVEEDATSNLPMEVRGQILNETQDMITPATVLGVENGSDTASFDDELHKHPRNTSTDAPAILVDNLDNFDDNAEVVSIQTFPTECEVRSEQQPRASPVGEHIEHPPVPQPQPFSSTATPLRSTSNVTSTGTIRSECSLPSVQAVSISESVHV